MRLIVLPALWLAAHQCLAQPATLDAAPDPGTSETLPPEPQGYRTQGYRAPVPATVAGGMVLDTEQAHRLWAEHAAIFIDALPRAPKPANLPPGTLWVEPPHDNIPGSVWLPDTGYGQLPPMMERYLRDNLQALTAGDTSRMLVVYCKANCWHSWNLAKRIIALGYTHVAWYSVGVDGWSRAGLPLQPAEQRPRPTG